ncbi:hypothetical protein SOVF_168210 [Spinacia oleracea]|uniref:Transcription repressor n=1 Tax=Spinacia oleracea TaxID=3562 RepID=A0A9R0JS99_SPIOL|nr:transcription repressor OFP1-like [Spinacia oleracea]KNA07835.1 hypothetical protein SOVF_168210 [Spinacia oleracea]
MGNQRFKFKLSDMIPNAWFYKLKDDTTKNQKSQSTKLRQDHLSPPQPPTSTVKTTRDTHQASNPEPQCHPRKSYHITRVLNPPSQELDFHPVTPPRKSKSSSKSRKSSRRTSSLSSSSCKSTTTFQSYPSKSNSPSSPPLFEDSLLKTEHKTEDYDIVIDVEKDYVFTFDFKLPPIITKKESKPINFSTQEKIIATPSSRRLQLDKGVRLKINSPRIMGIKQGQNGNSGRKSTSSKKRRSISESFAVVKSSFDPQRDFKESMVEMIVQNNLRGSKDLEDLLACYLSLNLDEYHDVIIEVFKQIWFELRHQK